MASLWVAIRLLAKGALKLLQVREFHQSRILPVRNQKVPTKYRHAGGPAAAPARARVLAAAARALSVVR